MGVSTESQKQFAFVIASAIEGELVRLVDCAYLKLLALLLYKRNESEEEFRHSDQNLYRVIRKIGKRQYQLL